MSHTSLPGAHRLPLSDDASSVAASTSTELSHPRLTADDAVALLQAVADPVRWTVLNRLAAQPACVCDIQEHVPVATNLLSYHLKVLRDAGLVTATRRGRWIDYALAPDAHDRMAHALPTSRDGDQP